MHALLRVVVWWYLRLWVTPLLLASLVVVSIFFSRHLRLGLRDIPPREQLDVVVPFVASSLNYTLHLYMGY